MSFGLLKWIVLFGIAFAIAWIVIFTFTQEPFTATVSARIFSYQTPPLAVVWYVVGAFVAGLGLGALALLVGSIARRSSEARLKKTIRELQEQVGLLKLEQTPSSWEKSTQSPSQYHSGETAGEQG